MKTVHADAFMLSRAFAAGPFAPANTRFASGRYPGHEDIRRYEAESRAARNAWIASALARAAKSAAAGVAALAGKSRPAAGVPAREPGPRLEGWATARAVGAAFARLARAVGRWNDARRTRAALMALSERQLRDIGLEACDIDRLVRDARAGRWPARPAPAASGAANANAAAGLAAPEPRKAA